MSEQIDWSKAPEWARYLAISELGHSTWCELLPLLMDTKDNWQGGGNWTVTDLRLSDLTTRLIARPTAPSWSGEGLPPVGVVCELRNAPGGWGKATIKYQGKGIIVWLWDRQDGNTDQIEFASCPDRLEFRHIRTPEQIESDARIKAAQEWLKNIELEYGEDVADQCENILMAAEEKRMDKL